MNPFKLPAARLPRIRFTVRRMMAAVAVTALILGGAVEAVRLRRRRDEFLRKAAEHAARGARSRAGADHRRYAQFSESLSDRLAPPINPFGLRAASRGSTEIAEKLSSMMKQQKDDAAKQRAQAVMYHKSAAYHTALVQVPRSGRASVAINRARPGSSRPVGPGTLLDRTR